MYGVVKVLLLRLIGVHCWQFRFLTAFLNFFACIGVPDMKLFIEIQVERKTPPLLMRHGIDKEHDRY